MLFGRTFTLSVDDCIVLCNKEVYDALGQRELLRILEEADDQCDAAGSVITQASARMPNTPMQFSISFVESVTSNEKKGLFGFKKNKADKYSEDMSIKSTFEGGVDGAAAEAVASAGFTTGLNNVTSGAAATAAGVVGAAGVAGTVGAVGAAGVFGDTATNVGPVIPNVNQQASSDKGIEVPTTIEPTPPEANVEFLDTSVGENKVVPEISAEEMMKSLFGEMKATSEADKIVSDEANTAAADAIVTSSLNDIADSSASVSASPSEGPSEAASPFVSTFNPFDVPETPLSWSQLIRQ